MAYKETKNLVKLFIIIFLVATICAIDMPTYIYYKRSRCISKILSDDVFASGSNLRLSVCKNNLIDIRYFLKHTPTLKGLNMEYELFNRLVQESEWVNNSITIP